VALDPRLRELDLGAWQGLTGEQARERFPDEHAAWVEGRDVPRGGGETYARAGARAVACVLEALPQVPAHGALVAVTHGGTARGALCLLLEADPAQWWRYQALGNTCCSVLVEHRNGWRLEAHGVGPAAFGAAPAAVGVAPDVEPVRY
jgi:probable phosphoglycerate mutase